MKAVIIGARGQLGREWCHYLDAGGVGMDYLAYGSRDLDITDALSVRQVLEEHSPTLLINCAAYTDVDKAESEPELAERVNSEAVRDIADLCNEGGIKLVHYSTDYVFPGNPADRDRWPVGYPETLDPAPVNWYGETKWRGEKAVRESGVAHLVIRTSWLCGQYGSNFIKTMIRLSGEKNLLEIIDDQWGSPSFAENVVANTMILIENGREGVYHVTSEGLITWYRLAKELFSILGKDIELKAVSSAQFKTLAKRPEFSKLSTRKLESEEGAEIWNWKHGLRRLLHQIDGR